MSISVTDFKNLQTLELCGGGITDAGVRSIKDLTSLTSLNLSQNMRLTDNALQYLSGQRANPLGLLKRLNSNENLFSEKKEKNFVSSSVAAQFCVIQT
jgi:Leucine-rich repeat (LRR) protein